MYTPLSPLKNKVKKMRRFMVEKIFDVDAIRKELVKFVSELHYDLKSEEDKLKEYNADKRDYSYYGKKIPSYLSYNIKVTEWRIEFLKNSIPLFEKPLLNVDKALVFAEVSR